jgi:hypothetical protein
MVEGKKLAGMAIAATAAALLMSGCAGTTGGEGGSSEKVQCQGVNACKGMSDCATADSSCAGKNACEGKGFVMLTPDDCQKVSGRA